MDYVGIAALAWVALQWGLNISQLSEAIRLTVYRWKKH